jgi:hypothetical protein
MGSSVLTLRGRRDRGLDVLLAPVRRFSRAASISRSKLNAALGIEAQGFCALR